MTKTESLARLLRKGIKMDIVPWLFSSFAGLIILWSTSIVRNYKVFISFSVALIISNLLGFLYSFFYAGSIGYSFIAFLLLSVLSLFFRSKTSFKNSVSETEDSTINTKNAKKGKLWAWFFFLLVTTAIGTAAYSNNCFLIKRYQNHV